MTDQNNALIVGIAQIIDYPSVYMGGPSRNSLRIAETIVKEFGADLAAARAENERLTKERDAQYEENVHRIAMQAKAEADRDIAKELLRSCINGNNALRKTAQERKSERDEARTMLADAERDMRQRAAKVAREAWRDGIGDKIRAIGDEILALPLKHADREGGV